MQCLKPRTVLRALVLCSTCLVGNLDPILMPTLLLYISRVKHSEFQVLGVNQQRALLHNLSKVPNHIAQ